MNAPLLDWEPLHGADADGLVTERCRVPAGWLVRTYASALMGAPAVALAFVPDRDGVWDDGWLPE